LRHAQSFLDFHNSNLFTQCAYEADLSYTDAVIDAGIADLVLLIDVTTATPRASKNARGNAERKIALPGNL
jgi:hypothetical protein